MSARDLENLADVKKAVLSRLSRLDRVLSSCEEIVFREPTEQELTPGTAAFRDLAERYPGILQAFLQAAETYRRAEQLERSINDDAQTDELYALLRNMTPKDKAVLEKLKKLEPHQIDAIIEFQNGPDQPNQPLAQ